MIALGKKFWSFHNLDRYEVIRRFREQYFGNYIHDYLGEKK